MDLEQRGVIRSQTNTGLKPASAENIGKPSELISSLICETEIPVPNLQNLYVD